MSPTAAITAAIDAMNATLKAHQGELVTYQRGAAQTPLTAIPAQTNLDTLQLDNAAEAAHAADWLIIASDLTLVGQPVEPAAGDKIAHTDAAGTTRTYTVAGLGGGRPWQYSDPQRRRYRIHTKLTAIA